MFNDLLFRLRSIFRRKAVESEADAELRFHFEQQIEKNIRAGLTREEAQRRARIDFGGHEQLKEELRDARGVNLIETFLQDIRYGLRVLRRSPGFTAVAVLTLGLGIGANTAIFSMVNGILLRALPYPQPGQLYAIHEVVPQWTSYGPSLPVNGGNFLAWQKEAHAFSAMTLIDSGDGALLGMGRPQWLYGAAVTPDFFSLVGVGPELGRFFQQRERVSSAEQEIVLTHQLWSGQFHSDPDILGKIVNVSGHAMTIVGVLPANFLFPPVLGHDPQYLEPFPWDQSDSKPGIGTHNYFVIARLKKGVTPRQAEAQLDVIEARIAQNDSRGEFNLYATLTPLNTEIVGSTKKVLWMLTVAAGLLLLIVCANLANLLLVKNTKRVREVALRSAFGAGRWRLARQFLNETLVLASAGACLGLIIAEGGLRLLIRNAPIGIPRVDQVRLDSTALWFTLGVATLAALVFGLLPSLGATQVELAEALKSAGPTMSASKQRTRLRAALVVAEIAVCTALLPGCLLLIESLRHVVLANQWMNEEHVITAELLVHMATPPKTNKDFLSAFNERNQIFS
ncbi:MAG: ABC transporter permease, partial [Candidatus Acidiferrum sp.]